MAKQTSSMDGFIPNNKRSELGASGRTTLGSAQPIGQSATPVDSARISVPHQLSANDQRQAISESLRQIDQKQPNENKGGPFRRRPRIKDKIGSRKRKIKRIIIIAIIVIVAAGLGIGGFLAYKALNATGNVFQGSILNLVKQTPLKEDANGRSNFLILGTTDDDPDHPGGNLTDSMMILSIDQNKKDAYIVSVPRDLYVSYGRSCDSGSEGKINVYFSCVNDGSTTALEQARLTATQQFVGNIFGIDIQYGVHVNSKVLPEAVDAVGGIDVDIEGSNGAPGILDRNFDEGCNYTCYRVKYTNGVHHLDGSAASFLSMARGDTAPTYGLSNSNFDREKNQQKILIALKEKATSTGTLTNISKVTQLLDAIGNNLRTNIQTSEIQTLAKVAAATSSSSIHTLSLIGTNPIMTTMNVGSQSVVVPSAGTMDYSQLQAFIKESFSGDAAALEDATVGVYNGSQTKGVATSLSTTLKSAGFNVDTIDDTSTDYTPKYTLYDLTGGKKPLTLAKLEKQLGVSVSTGTPAGIDSSDDFVVVIGDAISSSTSQ